MSDDIDRANDYAQTELERAIAKARSDKPAIVRPSPDECANECGANPREASDFCSAECREDYSLRARQLRRSGVK